jgi:hypothetical protein
VTAKSVRWSAAVIQEQVKPSTNLSNDVTTC